MLLDYCRPIICNADDKTLYDEDVFFLTGNTISQCFRFVLDNLCFKCQNFVSNPKDIVVLNCECRFCKRCLGKMVNEATDGKNIINSYEKSKLLVL